MRLADAFIIFSIFLRLPKINLFQGYIDEGRAFIKLIEKNYRHLIKTKVIIVQPIDVTSHLYGNPNDGP